jgi:peptidoglycan/xylan/chitin deacetylase (PgdA/CDA1 family)
MQGSDWSRRAQRRGVLLDLKLKGMRLWLLGGFFCLTLAWASPIYYQHAILVLTYHDVSEEVIPGTDTVSPERFRADLNLLLSSGFHFVSLKELEAFLQGGPIPPNALLLAFDNGYRGIYRYAFPFLKAHHIPAALFLIVAYVGHLANDLTWQEIRALSQSGLFAIESETYDLHRGFALTPHASVAATVAEARRAPLKVLQDLLEARFWIQAETGQLPNALVFPYGQYSPEFIQIAHQAGYRYMFTTLGWMIRRDSNPDHLPRIDVGVWYKTPRDVLGAILSVVEAFRQHPEYRLPPSYVRIWD